MKNLSASILFSMLFAFSTMLAAVCVAQETPGAPDSGAATVEEEAVEPISPEKKALLLQLFDAMQLEATQKQIYDDSTQQMSGQIAQIIQGIAGEAESSGEPLTVDLDEILGRYLNQAFEEMGKILNYQAMQETIYMPVYGKYFDDETLNGLIAFYQSPAGRKLVEVTPSLSSDVMRKMYDSFGPQMMELSMRLQSDLMKEMGVNMDSGLMQEEPPQSEAPPEAPEETGNPQTAE